MDPYKSLSLYWTPPAKVSSGTFRSFAFSKLMHQVPLILRLVLWHIYSIHHPRAMARARHGVLHKKKSRFLSVRESTQRIPLSVHLGNSLLVARHQQIPLLQKQLQQNLLLQKQLQVLLATRAEVLDHRDHYRQIFKNISTSAL